MSTLFDALEDFMLSREAQHCSAEPIDFYRRMFKLFLELANGTRPTNHMARSYLATVARRRASSAAVHAHARAVLHIIRFAYVDGWIEEPVTVRMPRLELKQLVVLSRAHLTNPARPISS